MRQSVESVLSTRFDVSHMSGNSSQGSAGSKFISGTGDSSLQSHQNEVDWFTLDRNKCIKVILDCFLYDDILLLLLLSQFFEITKNFGLEGEVVA